MKILIWNFQGRFLRAKEHHSWRQEWPCHPCLQSGTLNVLQVPPFLTPHSDTLLIEISTQNFQGIFLGVEEHHSWLQEWPCHPSHRSGTLNILQVTPFLTPLLDTLLIEISTQNFQGIFLGVKKHHSWRQEWSSPPCLWSGTLNVLQVKWKFNIN